MILKVFRALFLNMLLIDLLRHHTCNATPSSILSCAETASANLIPLNKPCFAKGGVELFDCIQRLPLQRHSNIGRMYTTIRLLEPVGLRNDTKSTYCAGVEAIEKKSIYGRNAYYIDQINTFVSNFSVGLLIVQKECWRLRKPKCPIEVLLRADILTLPLLAETPDYKEFWDFSSPLLRSQFAWLNNLTVIGPGFDLNPKVISNTSGSSISSLVIHHAYLYAFQGVISLLHDLPRLRHLEISFCHVTNVAPDTFNGSPGIRHLNLSGLHLTEIPSCVVHLTNLTTLIIESNVPDFNLRPEILTGLNNLERVCFSGTRIINWTTQFPQLAALKYLYLSNCRIEHLNISEFHFPVLEDLDLSHNKLSILPRKLFSFLHALRRVNLSNNQLVKWPNFVHLRFDSIDLSRNSLSTLVNLGQKGVTTNYLDVSYNIITRWNDPRVFVKENVIEGRRSTFPTKMFVSANGTHSGVVPWVEKLNLTANAITNVTTAMLQSMDLLLEVDLGSNMIDCASCLMGPLQRWLNATNTRVLTGGSADPLLCSLPAELRGIPVQDAPFDEAACRDPRVRLWWGLGLPLCLLAAVVVVSGLLGYHYRTEVAYLSHLAKVRSNSKRKTHGPDDSQSGDVVYDAFVCYSGMNRKFVLHHLARLLERPPNCYRLCLFDRDFRLGTHIVTNIVDAIDHSRKVIVILTKHFIESKWCQWELEMANHKLFGEDREFLVLLELEPLERRSLPRLLRFLLATRPVVRWPQPETAARVMAAAAELRRALGPSLSQRPLPQPRPRARTEGAAAPANTCAPTASTHAEDVLEDVPCPNSPSTDDHTSLLWS